MKIVYIQPPTSEQEAPLLYIKPDTTVHNRVLPLYIPDFTSDLRGQAVLLIKISKQGKCISDRFASKYYEQVSLGLALTAYDRQKELQAAARPWELATAFDGSMVVGSFLPIHLLQQETVVVFSENGAVILALQIVSEYLTLRTGDVLALPLTDVLYSMKGDTTWEATIQTERLFSVTVK